MSSGLQLDVRHHIHGVLCRLKAVWSMPERFRVVCTMQGAIQVIWITFTFNYTVSLKTNQLWLSVSVVSFAWYKIVSLYVFSSEKLHLKRHWKVQVLVLGSEVLSYVLLPRKVFKYYARWKNSKITNTHNYLHSILWSFIFVDAAGKYSAAYYKVQRNDRLGADNAIF